MWYDSLPSDQSWSSLWYKYIRCNCGGIRTFESQCPSCGEALPNTEWLVYYDPDGTEHRLPHAAMGGEGSYEDYVYLMMLEREWLKPVTDADRFLLIPIASRPSARAIVVIVFWTYFEKRIERLFSETARALPNSVLKDLLNPLLVRGRSTGQTVQNRILDHLLAGLGRSWLQQCVQAS